MDAANAVPPMPMPETPAGQPAEKSPSLLRRRFNELAAFLKPDKGFQPAAIVAGILLGTTSLVTPLLGSMVGAGLGLGLGLYLLMKTGDMVVENAGALGKKANISSMALGVGLGVLTSMPELVVSTAAMLAGDASIAISNVTGSNIANLLLILGGTAMLKKIDSKGASWKFNTAAMLGATGILGAQMAVGFLNPIAGAAMLAGLGLYLWKSYKVAQKDGAAEKAAAPVPTAEQAAAAAAAQAAEAQKPEMKAPKWLNIGWGLLATAGLIGAATFTVSSAVAFGAAAGISTAVVGILAVSVGTSLPELVVNLKSARKGDTDMAVGNILGSNVFNILGVGGLLALSGSAFPADLNPRGTILGLFNSLAFGASALLAAATMKKTGGTISRKTGALWVGLYAAFTAANAVLGRTPGAEAALPPGPEAALPPVAPAPPPPAPM